MGERNTTTRRCDVPKLPLKRVHVELTNVCNFTCEFCPNEVMARPKGVMDFALLEAVLEEIAAVGLTRHVLFHQQGEPTLHRRLCDAVRVASRLGLTSCVATNGSVLTDELVDGLMDAGLSQLVLSLHTPDGPSFSVRGARNLAYSLFEDRVTSAIRRVLAAPVATRVTVSFHTRTLLRLTTPTKGRAWPIVGRNADLRELLDTWAKRLLDLDGDSHDAVTADVARMSVGRREEVRLAPRLAFEVRPVGEWPVPPNPSGREWYPARFGRCHAQGLTDHFAILWDGQYSYCCDDHDGRTSQARFQDMSLLDFVDSEEVQSAIDGFVRRRPVNAYCRLCLGGPTRSQAMFKSLGAAVYFRLFDRHCCAGDADPSLQLEQTVTDGPDLSKNGARFTPANR